MPIDLDDRLEHLALEPAGLPMRLIERFDQLAGCAFLLWEHPDLVAVAGEETDSISNICSDVKRPVREPLGSASGSPGTLPGDLVDRHAGDDARGDLPHRIGRAGTDVVLRQPVHHVERAALDDPSPAPDHEVGVEAFAGVL